MKYFYNNLNTKKTTYVLVNAIGEKKSRYKALEREIFSAHTFNIGDMVEIPASIVKKAGFPIDTSGNKAIITKMTDKALFVKRKDMSTQTLWCPKSLATPVGNSQLPYDLKKEMQILEETAKYQDEMSAKIEAHEKALSGKELEEFLKKKPEALRKLEAVYKAQEDKVRELFKKYS